MQGILCWLRLLSGAGTSKAGSDCLLPLPLGRPTLFIYISMGAVERPKPWDALSPTLLALRLGRDLWAAQIPRFWGTGHEA